MTTTETRKYKWFSVGRPDGFDVECDSPAYSLLFDFHGLDIQLDMTSIPSKQDDPHNISGTWKTECNVGYDIIWDMEHHTILIEMTKCGSDADGGLCVFLRNAPLEMIDELRTALRRIMKLQRRHRSETPQK